MNSNSNVIFQPAVVMTASGQTSSPIVLGVPNASGWTGGSWASGTLTVTGTALSTATFGVLGSADGGITYSTILINPIGSPASTATTVTVTTSGLYQINLGGLTHIQFVTSGTFTATNLSILLTSSPNAL